MLAIQLVLTLVVGNRAAAGPTIEVSPESEMPALAPEVDWEEVSLFGDVGEMLGIAWQASYSQLLRADTLRALGVGALATWAVDDNDDAWLADLRGQEVLTGDVFNAIGDETALAIAALPAVTWLIANCSEDEKLRRFSIETLSAITLTYVESASIRYLVPTHQRPRYEEGGDEGFFDSLLGDRDSFPSGHLRGPLIVTLKTWDYYGWKRAVLPGAITVASALNRVADGSHYPSDMAAAAVLSLSAHLATRRVTRERDGGFHWGVAPAAGGGLLFTGGFDF